MSVTPRDLNKELLFAHVYKMNIFQMVTVFISED